MPYSASADAWNTPSFGLAVITLTTPEVALRPNSVPCGPRSTSTRSRSKNSVSNRRVENSGSPFKWIAVALSQVVPTHRSPMPRMVKLAPVKFVLVKVTFGSVS